MAALERAITNTVKTLNSAFSALSVVAAMAAPAAAQYSAPKINENGSSAAAVGEKYHIQINGDIWNPAVHGIIASSQFGLVGTQISFESDLKFPQTRFKEFGVELRA